MFWDLSGRGGKGGGIVDETGLAVSWLGIGGRGGGLVGNIGADCCCDGSGGKGGGILILGSKESSNANENTVWVVFSATNNTKSKIKIRKF